MNHDLEMLRADIARSEALAVCAVMGATIGHTVIGDTVSVRVGDTIGHGRDLPEALREVCAVLAAGTRLAPEVKA